MIKISRVIYKQKAKYVKLEGNYLRILNGSNLEDLSESEFLLVYDFKKILSPIKPSKIIVLNKNLDFKYIRANNCVISPYAKILSLTKRLFFKPQIGIVVGKDRVFGFLGILSFFSNDFGDIRDFCVDTYSPFSEFIQTETFDIMDIEINSKVKKIKINQFDYNFIFSFVKQYFHKLFIGDVIAYEFSDEVFEVSIGDKVKLICECGRIETEIEYIL
ncbi:MAG: hypothetical protein ABIL37_04970 [candidate division WOR-3 bacterium]